VFVALYRWRIRPGREDDFRDAWRRMTELVRERCKSGGSALFRDGDGTFVAIARWESPDAWRRCFADGTPDAALAARMSNAVLERLPAAELEGLDDLWAPFRD
jgi:heme-degrading monooxygenase HmoA